MKEGTVYITVRTSKRNVRYFMKPKKSGNPGPRADNSSRLEQMEYFASSVGTGSIQQIQYESLSEISSLVSSGLTTLLAAPCASALSQSGGIYLRKSPTSSNTFSSFKSSSS
jgi:hypothetical protein